MIIQTLLGFDYGSKKIGIATGQTLTNTATPLTTLKIPSTHFPWLQITTIVEDWRPNLLILGWPDTPNSQLTALQKAILQFKKELETRYQLPTQMADERLSSVAAQHQIEALYTKKQARQRAVKEQLDAVAAQIILETWLSAQPQTL